MYDRLGRRGGIIYFFYINTQELFNVILFHRQENFFYEELIIFNLIFSKNKLIYSKTNFEGNNTFWELYMNQDYLEFVIDFRYHTFILQKQML